MLERIYRKFTTVVRTVGQLVLVVVVVVVAVVTVTVVVGGDVSVTSEMKSMAKEFMLLAKWY